MIAPGARLVSDGRVHLERHGDIGAADAARGWHGVLVTLRLKHIDFDDMGRIQKPRDMATTFGKFITTYIAQGFPLAEPVVPGHGRISSLDCSGGLRGRRASKFRPAFIPAHAGGPGRAGRKNR